MHNHKILRLELQRKQAVLYNHGRFLHKGF